MPCPSSEPDGTRPTEGVQGVVQVLVKVARALSCPNSEPDGSRPVGNGPDAAQATTNSWSTKTMSFKSSVASLCQQRLDEEAKRRTCMQQWTNERSMKDMRPQTEPSKHGNAMSQSPMAKQWMAVPLPIDSLSTCRGDWVLRAGLSSSAPPVAGGHGECHGRLPKTSASSHGHSAMTVCRLRAPAHVAK